MEQLFYYRFDSFSLTIGLRVETRRKFLFDADEGYNILDQFAVELCTLIRYNRVGNVIEAEDIVKN